MYLHNDIPTISEAKRIYVTSRKNSEPIWVIQARAKNDRKLPVSNLKFERTIFLQINKRIFGSFIQNCIIKECLNFLKEIDQIRLIFIY